jgi:hypothetical protein
VNANELVSSIEFEIEDANGRPSLLITGGPTAAAGSHSPTRGQRVLHLVEGSGWFGRHYLTTA